MATFKAIMLKGNAHLKQDGTKNIKIRIYHNRTPQYLKTEFYIEPGFLGDDGNISSFYPHAEHLNFELGELIQKMRGVCIKLGTSRTSLMSCIELKEQIVAALEPQSEHIDFIEYCNSVIEKTQKTKTAEWYSQSTTSLCKFYKRTKIDIMDITSQRLNAFAEYLATETKDKKALEPGAISNYLRGLRALFNKAKKHYNNLDYDIIKIPHDPFSKVTIPQYRRKRKNISVEDIRRIRDTEFMTERANMSRDVFMMMFYLMGININDFYKLTKYVYGRIEYERSKTDNEFNSGAFALSIKAEPELKRLLDKYSNGTLLSLLKTRYVDHYSLMKAVNIGLSQISEELNIPKITTNWARHSWASIARNKAGVSKADVDFCLGHVNNDYKMADIYIDIDYSIYDEANRKVLDLLK